MSEDNNLPAGPVSNFLLNIIDIKVIQTSLFGLAVFKSLEYLYDKWRWQGRSLVHDITHHMTLEKKIELIEKMDDEKSELYHCGFVIDNTTINDPQTAIIYNELTKHIESIIYTFEDHQLSSAFYRNYKSAATAGHYFSFTFGRKNDPNNGGYNYILTCNNGPEFEKYRNLSNIVRSICIGILRGQKLGKRIAMIEDMINEDDEQEFVN